jgi:hypothetical protein
MGFKKNNPGCDCCEPGGDPGCPVCGDKATPDEWLVTIPTGFWTEPSFGSPCCTDNEGDFTVTRFGALCDHKWRYTFSGSDNRWTFLEVSFSSVELTIRTHRTFGGGNEHNIRWLKTIANDAECEDIIAGTETSIPFCRQDRVGSFAAARWDGYTTFSASGCPAAGLREPLLIQAVI